MDGESLLERWFAAGDEGELDAFDDFLHPDVVVHVPLGLSTEGPMPKRRCGEMPFTPCPTSATTLGALPE